MHLSKGLQLVQDELLCMSISASDSSSAVKNPLLDASLSQIILARITQATKRQKRFD